MNRKRIARNFAISAAATLPIVLIAGSVGFSVPSRNTGGNFSGETSCATCHTGALNPDAGGMRVTFDGQEASAFRYTPGAKVMVKVEVSQPGKQTFGFQFTGRQSDGCVQAGVFEAVENKVRVLLNSATPEGCSGSTVQFPAHWDAVDGAGVASWEFPWTAPNNDIGTVRFAAATLAGDKDGTKAGDTTYTWEGSAEPSGSTSVAPKINPGGVVLASGTPVVTQLSPGAIASVYGDQFAPDGTSVLQAELDEDQRVQTKVANTCVEVNGEWTPLFAILPNQINFQIPHDAGLGNAEVRVVRSCNSEQEQRTEAEMVTIVSAAPAFFNFTNAADGKNPIAALKQDYSLLAPDGMYQTPGAGPAKSGEYVHLYATGLGLTDPEVVTGGIPSTEIPNGVAEVKNLANVRITVGGIDVPAADIAYVGVAPCCAGLYQVTFKLPANLTAGDHEVRITVDGVTSPAGPYITIAAN